MSIKPKLKKFPRKISKLAGAGKKMPMQEGQMDAE